MHLQQLRQLLLFQIPVFPEISQTVLMHNHHPELLCSKGHSLIDF